MWEIVQESFNRKDIGKWETVFTLGNGYLGVRGVEEESWNQEEVGLFINGVYNRPPEDVTELVNLGNPFEANLYIDKKPLSFNEYKRVLHLENGILERYVSNEKVEVITRRFASMADKNLLLWEIEITAKENVEIELDSLINTERKIGYDHLINIYQDEKFLILKTKESNIEIGFRLEHEGENFNEESLILEERKIGKIFHTYLERGKKARLKKYIWVTENRIDGENPLERLKRIEKDVEIEEKHKEKWKALWNRADIEIEGDDISQRNIRYAIFQLLQMAPWHSSKVSIPAKALSGEGYKGHIFWDNEIFVFPFFLYTFPEIARNLLLYRYHCIEGYRKKAKEEGYEGISIAWESADTGEEETPKWGKDAKTGEKVRILTGEQEIHITGDVMWAFWQYYLVTGDEKFLFDYGVEMFIESARYWVSRARYNSLRDTYEILKVIGPDEFHEEVDNNYYTNYLARWNLLKAKEVLELVEVKDPEKAKDIKERIKFREEERRMWEEVAEKIYLPSQGKFIEQFEGFNKLEEVDVEEIKKSGKPADAILGHSGVVKSKVIKQADVIALFFLFYDDFPTDQKIINFKYYEPLTVHSSSLSPSMHAVVSARLGLTELAYEYFKKTSEMDLSDLMGNTKLGLHAAAIGGTWESIVFGFLGIRVDEKGLRFDPKLPNNWKKLKMNLHYKGNILELNIKKV
ncbi:MAG: kojibiose phosphorylase [Dictyoglomus sp. NZ13-RE01]|nr:MAG: kojibiose phosphorylase [Dictyoglomus sp. NZ13-RE01]